MKKRAGQVLTELLIVALVIVGGCAEDRGIATQPKESTSVGRTPAPPAPTPAPTPSSASNTRSAPPARKPAPGEAMIRMALPTGDFATSVLSLEKSAPKEVLVGKPFAYTIRLANLTGTALKGVVLTGKLSDNVKLTGTTPKGAIKGSHATWDVGVLGPKETKTFVMQGSAQATGRDQDVRDAGLCPGDGRAGRLL